MAITNHERVGKALDLLKAGLGPFVHREVKGALESRKLDAFKLRDYAEDPVLANKPTSEWDVAGLLKLMWETWNDVFRTILGPAERSLVGELRGHRNKWAHQESFSSDDAYRALDRWAGFSPRYRRRSPMSSKGSRWNCYGCASTSRRVGNGAGRRAPPSEALSPPASSHGGRSSRPTRTSRAGVISKPSSQPTSGRCTSAKGRTSTGTRSSSFGGRT